MLFCQLINELKKTYPVKLVRDSYSPFIRDAAFLAAGQTACDDDVIYFALGELPADAEKLPRQLVVSGRAMVPDCAGVCSVAVVPQKYILQTFNLARRLIESENLYDELAALADRTQTIQSLIDAATVKVGNSLVFCDMEYRVIASSSLIPVLDPLWKDNIAKGYCSYDFVSEAMTIETVKNAPKCPGTMDVTRPESPYRKLVSYVCCRGAVIGFVLMIASELPLSLAHFNMLRSISDAIAYAVERYAPNLLKGIDSCQQYMYQLLIGADAKDLAPLLDELNLPKRMSAMCVRQSSGSEQSGFDEKTIMELLAEFPGVRICHYEDSIAALLPVVNGISPDAGTLNALRTFADGHGARIGISYSFSHINDFAVYYRQAEAALDMAARTAYESSVALYERQLLYNLLSKTADDEDLSVFCHPSLDLLRQYDNENGSALYKTLRCFVDNDGSVKATAEAMFLHRNSLNYRLECIKDILGMDINAPDVKYFLRISFDIDRYMGRG